MATECSIYFEPAHGRQLLRQNGILTVTSSSTPMASDKNPVLQACRKDTLLCKERREFQRVQLCGGSQWRATDLIIQFDPWPHR